MDKRKRRLLCMLEGGKKYRWIRGVPPLSFRAFAAGTLENYRIYGNTVNGESVGEKTANLFDKDAMPTARDKYLNADGTMGSSTNYNISAAIEVVGGEQYTLSNCVGWTPSTCWYDSSDEFISGFEHHDVTVRTVTAPTNAKYMRTSYGKFAPNNKNTLMINSGSTALPYEPYGYKVSITVTNSGTTSNETIYLPEPIKMVGSEAEYVDYAEQKMHRIGADDVDVTLPALPTLAGTNVLTVGTAVQPSEIEVKGKIKDL